MKTLNQYLKDRNETRHGFAKRNKLSVSTVWRACEGRPVSGPNALAIYNACGCQISLKGLIDPDLAALAREAT